MDIFCASHGDEAITDEILASHGRNLRGYDIRFQRASMFVITQGCASLPNTRITPALLREWKTKVSSSTFVIRKCYIVETAALVALPQYPPDSDKWIIPRVELVLPADIYTDGALTIDDGYDRAKLNVPGVLHIERAAKLSQERPSQALPGRSSGSTAHLQPEALAYCVRATSLPLPLPPNRPQGVALAVRPPLPRGQAQSVAGARQNFAQATLVGHDDPKVHCRI